MNSEYERLQKCFQVYQEKIDFKPKVALILGSGLGDYAEQIDQKGVLEYHEIPGFPVSTVPGHKGRFIFGLVDDVPVVVMQGRVHYYEGYDMKDVVLPTRLMRMMGAEILFLTNAAGGANKSFHAGDFMLIEDQIGSFVPSPLRGANLDELGPRFPDMSHIYDEDLKQIIRESAAELQIPLQSGVYMQLPGPNFETPAEIRMCQAMGADAVGMSTACEGIAANHMGMKICGISCISNQAAGISSTPLSHEEVQETANRVAPLFKSLITESIRRMGSL